MSATQTVASKDELNKLPPADTECPVCCRDEDEDDIKIQRCTSCKNQFYCSSACQAKDWKRHKFDCSALPIGELEYPAPLDDEHARVLAAEVGRVATIFHQWEVAYVAQRGEKGFKVEDFALNSNIIGLELSPAYSSATYTRVPPEHKTFKCRLPIMLVTRLFLIHLMSPSPSTSVEDIDKLRHTISTWQVPSSFAQLWAPKIACRPGELSPGEYAQLAGMMQTLNMDEWFNLSIGKATDGPKTEDEKAFARRLVNLALIYKSFWNVK